MSGYTKNELYEVLISLGISKGDVIYCSSSLFELGKFEGVSTKNELCNQIYDVIYNVIGENGTLVVPCFTPLCGMNGEPYIHEDTKTTAGIFSEFVRTELKSYRSLHPINSVAAIGKHAKKLISNIPSNCYAIGSPFHRLYELNAKAITLGAFRQLGAWVHLSEAMSGLPYVYNKLLDIDVFKSNRKVNKEFYTTVRYLNKNIKYDIQKVEKIMLNNGVINKTELGAGFVSVMNGKEFFENSLSLLKSDPYIYLSEKVEFEVGSVPRDGFTEVFHK